MSSDLLGKSKPVTFVCYIQDAEINKHEMILYDECNKKAGEIVITTQFEIIDAEPEPLKDINLNSTLKVLVKEATFLKDFDTFGKQDPFAQFLYDQEKLKTRVIEDGGKKAVWDEEFELKNIMQQIKLKQSFVLETYDKDMVTEDLLGCSHSFTLNRLCQNFDPKDFDLELYDDNFKQVGNAKITTTCVDNPLDPLPTNVSQGCKLEISILKVNLKKSGLLEGILEKKDDEITRDKLMWKYLNGENINK